MTRSDADGFFPGFRWALPRAFAGPLGACRFEQGDILYDTDKAYEGTWGDAVGHVGWSLQIKAPTRGPIGKTEKDADSIFAGNWHQSVTLELTDHRAATTRVVTTTQGRLYTMLWKGEIDSLDQERPHPAMPLLARSILKQLDATAPHFRNRMAKKKVLPIVFLMPSDATNELLSLKHARVQDALSGEFDCSRDDASPTEAGLTSESGFVPTLSIVCYAVEGSALASVEATLKRALYTPTKAKKTEREAFKTSAHGHLRAL